MKTLVRNSHFLGAKLRTVRKRLGLTLDELSARCIQKDPELAPSVSYLSMIEGGKRSPSEGLLELLADVLQRDVAWFLDENSELERALPRASAGGLHRAPLEPAFLFSKDLLQATIPELLTQTGTTGKQFAHLLIRSHQELSHNDFPELERAAEAVGQRRFPLDVDDLMRLAKRSGLELRWFEQKPMLLRDNEQEVKSVMRSFYEAPRVVHLNQALKADPARLKFDLATHIAHKILHGGDGVRSPHATGGEPGSSPDASAGNSDLQARDILHAWRDFECSFFAGALLCPRIPFRRFLNRCQHRVEPAVQLGLTPALVMRRMTKVSSYPHWHFFDAYPPGFLRAVYRGNGIPLPWGNMGRATDPCPQWAVFRMIHAPQGDSGSQFSILHDAGRQLLYCCHTVRTRDMAGNAHVLSAGIDLAPALEANGDAAANLIAEVNASCARHGGEGVIPAAPRAALRRVAKVLNIEWVETALDRPARIICPRAGGCPRPQRCAGAAEQRAPVVTDVIERIMSRSGKKGRRRVST
jgi:transcriptional regulator with XRE-family HTH domain